MISFERTKVEIACRVGSVLSILSMGMSSPEAFHTTEQGIRFDTYASCRLGEDKPSLIAFFRDHIDQRRAIVLGIRKDGTELYQYAQSQDKWTAEGSFEFQGGIANNLGESFSLDPGNKIIVSLYPAKRLSEAPNINRASQLITSEQPLAGKEVVLPKCTS